MPAQKKVSVFFSALAILFFSPKIISAQVVINEFQVKPDQWIELYNKGENLVDISGWVIDDAGSVDKYIISSGTTLLSKKCISFQSGKFDWNTASSDTVKLLDSSSGVKEEYSYSSVPGEGISIGRVVDGDGDLVVLTNSSRDKLNTSGESCLAPVPTPTSTPTPVSTPTLTPTPSPAKATYKINEVKNKDGDILSSVKIYVDGIYVHHYAPEILTFCDGCKCDTDVDCGFGEHVVELQKTGYEDWTEGKNFVAGSTFESSPILKESSVDTPSIPTLTPTPTSKPSTPTATRATTPTPEVTESVATESGEVLGESEQTPTPVLSATPSPGLSKNQLLPKIFIVLGLFILFGAAFYLWYNRLK